jgi:hypothetical protein
MALTSMWQRRSEMSHDAGDEVGGRTARSVSCGDGSPLGLREAASCIMIRTCACADQLEAQARELLAGAWASVAPEAVALPPESTRRGPGPRVGLAATGTGAKLWWSSSISHSAAGSVVAAAVAVQPIDCGVVGPGITVGVDVEPVHRFVHPGVARLIAAQAVAEAPPVSNGTVPLLAVACVKEAIYKADRRQSGRTLADYAWIEARPTENCGWSGIAEAVGDRTQCFSVLAIHFRRNWLALAIAMR